VRVLFLTLVSSYTTNIAGSCILVNHLMTGA
jgi:hypothetical protein